MKRPVLISKATRDFFAEGRKTPGYSLLDFIHGYVYGRWTYFYIAMGTGRHPWAKHLRPLAGRLLDLVIHRKPAHPGEAGESAPTGANQVAVGMANTYHGKVMPLEAARQLIEIKQAINLPDLEHVIPYDRARALVLENPKHIVVLDCPCRLAKPNPCTPLDVCLVIGEPFASFLLEHQPKHTRPVTPQEAVAILKAEDERGHVHHAFFKDAMLGRFYAICNCCACCCGAMHAHNHGTPMLASSGYLAAVDEELCLACGTCVDACQFAAITQAGAEAAQVDPARCMGCGVCANQCPNDAMALQRAPEKGEPLEIIRLLNQASGQ